MDTAQQLAEFMVLMAREMRNNEHKGSSTDWLKVDPKLLLSDTLYHAAKLAFAIKEKNDSLVEEFSADVANMAMMTLLAYKYQKTNPRSLHDSPRDPSVSDSDDY
jgi:hypothetical protein